jgi:carbamoyl-phosphate synthase large subunit
MLSILLTGAGAPGTWGTATALRRNPANLPVRIVGVDVRADSVGRYLLNGYYQVRRPTEAGYLDEVIEICRQEHIDVIVPQTSAETLFLSCNRPAIEKAGFRLLAPPSTAVEVAENKGRLYEICSTIGVAIPATRVAYSLDELEAAASELGYPAKHVIVKPPVSNGMRGFRILREGAWNTQRFFAEKPSADEISLAELIAILKEGTFRPLLVSEFLEGPEYSVDVLRTSALDVIVPRRRTEIRSGISFVTDIEYRTDLIEAARKATAALGLLGVFGFQFRCDASDLPKVIEANPRIQGTMAASIVSGYNIIWGGICDVMGWEVPPSPPLQAGRFSRYWGGVGVTSDGHRAID